MISIDRICQECTCEVSWEGLKRAIYMAEARRTVVPMSLYSLIVNVNQIFI